MSIRKRTLAAAAGLAFVVTTVAAPVALANGDRHDNDNGRSRAAAYPDPTTCADGLLTLVKVRSDEHGNGARVTVAERQDRDAQDALRRAQRDDADARTVEATTLSKWNLAKNQLAAVQAEPLDTQGHADRLAAAVTAEQVAHQSYLEAQGDRIKADADLVKARQDAAAKRSYLAELRVKLSDAHGAVVRLTVLVNGLCNQPTPVPGFRDCAAAIAVGVHDIPASDPRYRKDLDSDGDGIACEQPPAPVDNPPVDVTPPAPVIVDNPAPVIINNPSIGQVPTGSNTGGGAEAATVE